MKLLVTGANGQLGREVCIRARERGHAVTPTNRTQLDITEPVHVRAALQRYEPDVVINAAGWTAVDAAEDHKIAALRVNVDGPRNLAEACESHDIPLVHYSTDYVFDGAKDTPYSEADNTGPINAYGRSKLMSEEQVRSANARHLILRTSWLFSRWGNNFVKTMLQLGMDRNRLSVVSDQRGKPTSASELARITVCAIDFDAEVSGTYHVAQPEAVSWHEFAEAIFAEAGRQGIALSVREVEPITSDDFRSQAKRPANSVLDCSSIEAALDLSIEPWMASLQKVIMDLKSEGFFGR